MKIDPKLKGGLAWAGLFVILAVPAANILFGGQSDASTPTLTSDTRAVNVKPAVPALKLDPVETASVGAKDAVDALLQKGKKLPSYISDGDSAAAPKPLKVTPVVPVAPAETAVAAVDPAVQPPVPLPRSARPQWTAVATAPAPKAPSAVEEPLILDEEQVAAVERFPLSDDGTSVVTGDQLEEWDSGSLADYLERQGLLNEDGPADAQQSGSYDPDGFFLDEGPNTQRRAPRDDADFFLF